MSHCAALMLHWDTGATTQGCHSHQKCLVWKEIHWAVSKNTGGGGGAANVTAGEQDLPPQNMLLWHKNSTELKACGCLKPLICLKAESLERKLS